MANGSILVVGGEEGSNGRAVPTLEILPRPVGGTLVFCLSYLRSFSLSLGRTTKYLDYLFRVGDLLGVKP